MEPLNRNFQDNIFHEIRNVRRNVYTSKLATLCPGVYEELQKKIHIIINGAIIGNVRDEVDNIIIESRRKFEEQRKTFIRRLAQLREARGEQGFFVSESFAEEAKKIHNQIFQEE